MSRDFDAKKHGYSAQTYIETLTEGFPPHWKRFQLFMHDNAPIHKARATLRWLEERKIETFMWPPYSPDLELRLQITQSYRYAVTYSIGHPQSANALLGAY